MAGAPQTLKAMGDLAIFCSPAGRKDEALNVRDEVLALSRKFLGPNAPNTLSALNSLAVSLLWAAEPTVSYAKVRLGESDRFANLDSIQRSAIAHFVYKHEVRFPSRAALGSKCSLVLVA